MNNETHLLDVAKIREEIATSWGYLGSVEPAGKGAAIGHLPDLGPQWYLHRFYPPAQEADIDAWQKRANLTIPPIIKGILKQANGMSLFRCLSIGGVASSLPRDPKNIVGQAVSLDYGNIREKWDPIPASHFGIGGMTGHYTTGELYITAEDRIELWGPNENTECGAEWPDIVTFFSSEIERLSKFFDEKGHSIPERRNRMPQNAANWEASAEKRKVEEEHLAAQSKSRRKFWKRSK